MPAAALLPALSCDASQQEAAGCRHYTCAQQQMQGPAVPAAAAGCRRWAQQQVQR
jgi:hypothetical protein